MKGTFFAAFAALFAAFTVSCSDTVGKADKPAADVTTTAAETATESTGTATKSTSRPDIYAIPADVAESDGIIEPLDANELITKLSFLHYDMTLDEITDVFGKEPQLGGSGVPIFTYYSGDIAIKLWGPTLWQAAVVFRDQFLALDIGAPPTYKMAESGQEP